MYTTEQIEKIGNAIRYLAKDKPLHKTQILKLIYLLDEVSLKKFGLPFFNIKYEVWQYGPVAKDLYFEFLENPSMLKNHIELIKIEGNDLINPVGAFCDDEFSDNDIELLDYVKERYVKLTSGELVRFTHRKNSLWYKRAEKEGVLEKFEKKEQKITDYVIDMKELVKNNEVREFVYNAYIEHHGEPV